MIRLKPIDELNSNKMQKTTATNTKTHKVVTQYTSNKKYSQKGLKKSLLNIHKSEQANITVSHEWQGMH